MQTLVAQRMSSAATPTTQPGFRCEVHSVFRRVLNLTANGLLITVTDMGSSDLPNGVFVRLPEGSDFESFRLQTGNQGYGDGKELLFPGAGLAIDLSNVDIVPSEKSINERLLLRNERGPRLAAVHKLACRLAPSEGLTPLWRNTGDILRGNVPMQSAITTLLQVASTALVDLINGVREIDVESIKSGAGALTGLGIGLTPSGDDVLTGFVAALVLWMDATRDKGQTEPILKAIRDGVGRKTNLIALNYLDQAMRSEISEQLYRFISCLIASKPADLQRTIEELFAYGASSGAELGLGAYLGVAVSMERLDN